MIFNKFDDKLTKEDVHLKKKVPVGLNKNGSTIYKELCPPLTVPLDNTTITFTSTYGLSTKDIDKLRSWLYKRADREVWKQYVEYENSSRRKQADKIQEKFDRLYKIHADLGYKSDLIKLDEIYSLLYCEADSLLNKMIEKINKKSTAKAIRLYKAWCDEIGTDPITCA